MDGVAGAYGGDADFPGEGPGVVSVEAEGSACVDAESA